MLNLLEILEIQFYQLRMLKKIQFLLLKLSSYQLEYSKIFKSKYSAILNLSPDHIERHQTTKKICKG